MLEIVNNLRRELHRELPGMDAQIRMAPSLSRNYYEQAEHAVKAAVLVLLYPYRDLLHFALMKRKKIKGDTHSGQVSLPGGRMDQNDKNLMDTALRETEEELGIDRNSVEILGNLTDLYVFASNHIVSPFVGFIDQKPRFSIDRKEVDWLIEANIPYLLSPHSRKLTDLQVRGFQLKNVPYFDIEGEIVWGATAMMLNEFLEIVDKVK